MLSKPRASNDLGLVFATLQPNYTNTESVTGRYIVIGDSVVVPIIIGYAVGDCGVLDTSTIANPYNSSANSGAPEDVVQYANGDVQLEFFSNASSSSNILIRSRRSSFHAARTSVSPPLNPSFWTCLNTTITTTLALITANATDSDSDSPHHHNRDSLSQGGAIAILVVSIVVPLLVVLTVFVWCCCCSRKAKRKQLEDRERVVREGEAYYVQMEMLPEPGLELD